MKLVVKKNVTIMPIETLIRVVRGQKVMFDRDLAALYDVETKTLNRAVKRNLERFPDDFMFQLSLSEAESLRSQIVILDSGRGKYPKYAPFAFTEHGVAMLSSVLRSPRAVQMNIAIMRAFVRMRELVATNKEFAVRIDKLERNHQQTNSVLEVLIEDIGNLSKEIDWIKNPPLKPKRRIGYIVGKEDEA
jgi:hypothetical protein